MFYTTMPRKDVRICQIRIFQPMGRKSENGGTGKNEMRPQITWVVGGRFGDEDEIVFIIFHRGFWMEQRQSNGLNYIIYFNT